MEGLGSWISSCGNTRGRRGRGHLDRMVLSRTRDCSNLLELANLMVFGLGDNGGKDAGTVASHNSCGWGLWSLICVGKWDCIRGGATASLTVLSYILRSSLNPLFPPYFFLYALAVSWSCESIISEIIYFLNRLPALKWIGFRISCSPFSMMILTTTLDR